MKVTLTDSFRRSIIATERKTGIKKRTFRLKIVQLQWRFDEILGKEFLKLPGIQQCLCENGFNGFILTLREARSTNAARHQNSRRESSSTHCVRRFLSLLKDRKIPGQKDCQNCQEFSDSSTWRILPQEWAGNLEYVSPIDISRVFSKIEEFLAKEFWKSPGFHRGVYRVDIVIFISTCSESNITAMKSLYLTQHSKNIFLVKIVQTIFRLLRQLSKMLLWG